MLMAADFPGVTVLPSVEAYDDPKRMGLLVRSVMESRPRIAGIYSMGSGNRPMLEALRHCARRADPVVIAHELTPTTKAALLSNEIAAVITQNVGHLVRSALRVLRAVCDGQPIHEAQERIRIEIVLRENLPAEVAVANGSC